MAKVIDISKFKEAEIQEKLQVKLEQKRLNSMVKEKSEKKSENPFKGMKFQPKSTNLMDKAKCAEAQMKEEKAIYEREKMLEQMERMERMKMSQSKEGVQINQYISDMLSVPVKDPIKKEIFKNRIQRNDVIQDYINETLVVNSISRINKNLRFMAYVGLELLNTEEDYKKYKFQMAHLQKAQESKEDSKVEEIPSENDEQEK